MASSKQLESWSNDLAVAAKTLCDRRQSDDDASMSHLAMTTTNMITRESDGAKRNIFAMPGRMQTHSAEPTEFIQQLAHQNQLLACLKWLGEFQVLACIPLSGSIPIKEAADLAAVPETQLCRIVRMTATAGFLHEPDPGHIAHTALSAPFVTNLSFLDAAMFLAETAVPTALHMATATQRHGQICSSGKSAYSIAFNTSQPFELACVERARLQRQWAAYRSLAGDMDDCLIELLKRLNWWSLGNACIVDACAYSTKAATALAEAYPSLRFVVQMKEPASDGNGTIGAGQGETWDGRITVQKRMPGAVQMVSDAAVYIIRLSTPSPCHTTNILAELNAHLGVLRANALSTLILAPQLLPEPGTVDPVIESMARLRDLSRLQLTNECSLELDELIKMINSVHDGMGRLVVINKIRSGKSATAALGVRYQAYVDDSANQTAYDAEASSRKISVS
ncbi:O-methyltransferase family protein [Tothia fuscella]|uniref:O-methyltransferase family protein n=1 Tax=Tothia fuscella TaxID=1048955 RepID=A0A9P4TXW0_9PEZI|nr:O-methyltransferase family protein [Tothia fuscella]